MASRVDLSITPVSSSPICLCILFKALEVDTIDWKPLRCGTLQDWDTLLLTSETGYDRKS
ncbi:hypothetical protein EYF80_006852 [Liparis tanakae]|uniref:Uncharacterized protein n=1 Tax=Liparis tanakae TaxID=230148 RepID=A0A4Z2IY41_9TELE|nr:hypothetical protein EYF80_006852 [Liparis tanakae]